MFYVLVLLAVLTRLIPHPPNFACIGALGLFAGCYMKGRIAPLIPLAAMLASDVLGHMLKIDGMGFYSPIAMVGVYAGFGLPLASDACCSSSEDRCGSPLRLVLVP